MARIRSIKPELPQSESMGRVCREARLCFILLFTLADDAGRLRGSPRMLASLLYPYDDDAKKLIGKWLEELDAEKCITRYEDCGDQYIQINAWLSHQKIDKPSPSKIPPPSNEHSRGFARIREASTADQGRDQGGDQGGEGNLSATQIGDGVAVPEQPYRVAPCPNEEIANAYAAELPQLAQLAVMTEARKGHINARWREVCAAERFTQAEGIAYFRDYFAFVAKSPFLTGNGSPGKDGRVWKADFDWLLNPSNFVKVIERKYHGKRAA